MAHALAPDAGGSPGGIGDAPGSAPDETSRRDLDVEAFPLPRVPHALAWLVALRVLVVGTALALGAGAAVLGGSGAALGAIVWPALWLLVLILSAVGVSLGSDDAGMLRLERDAHPRFFALVDDVCARLSLTPPRAFFLINESNAYNASVQRESSILLGFPSVLAYDVVALRSTLGHELGHHMAGDSHDDAQVAFSELQNLARLPFAVFPFAPLARRLEQAAGADTLRRSRLNEHAADFWGGVAAGQGTTAASLLKDRRASHLWSTVLDDIDVLQEAGLRVGDLYRILARCRAHADDDGFEMLPSSRPTEPTSTHPAEGARIAATEERLQALPAYVVGEGRAVDLFEAAEAITLDLTELFYDPHGDGGGDWLDVVGDDALWDRYLEALGPQLRGALAAAGHPRLALPMPAVALFHEVRLLVEAGVRFVVDRRDPALPGVLIPRDTIAGGRDVVEELDVTARIMGLLLDRLVGDGALRGTAVFGAVRAVAIGDVECFRLVLAARLASGERWDDLADELERVAAQRRRLETWAGGFAPPALRPPPAPAWERDTEENALPPRGAPADNSDRERSAPDGSLADAPAAE